MGSSNLVTETEVVIIGAGQAGLAAGYYIKQTGKPFILLDQSERIGDSWANRYDSLTLFTPRGFSSLPGLPMSGDPAGYPTKDEVAGYLQQYVIHHQLPVALNVSVEKLNKEGGYFDVYTSQRVYRARSVIVATGPFQSPYIPEAYQQLPDSVRQLHSSTYTNSSALKPGSVLIVGGGNSGAQIAVELAKERQVILAVSEKPRFMPLEWMGRSVFWWLQKTGILYQPEQSWIGRRLRRRKDPIFGYELQELLRGKQVILHPRLVRAEKDRLIFEDGADCRPANVIWATGFRSDYRWIAVPGATDSRGMPIHLEGVSPVNGLFYVGLPWQRNRASALMGGVGNDAQAIVQKLS